MYEAESDSTENYPRISHKINDWLINQISTGICLPNTGAPVLLLTHFEFSGHETPGSV